MHPYPWKYAEEDGLKKIEGVPKGIKTYYKSQGSWQIKTFYRGIFRGIQSSDI